MADVSKTQRQTDRGRGEVYRVDATHDERMQLAANRILFEPGKPQRYNGPLVVVEHPDGKRTRECGLDSAEGEIARYDGAAR